jgi:hypothetical protein
VYLFAYYEWTIIYAIEYLRKGFVSRYSRGASMTSENVRQELQDTINNPRISFAKVSKKELQACCDEFESQDDRTLIQFFNHRAGNFYATELSKVAKSPTPANHQLALKLF